MATNTAGAPDGAANGSARRTDDRRTGDRKWPRTARLLVTIALLPVWAAVILASENSFNFIGGVWFGPLMTALIVAVVITVWATTTRSQR